MAIELVPLCTVHVQLKLPIEVRTGCAGTRVIFEVASAQAKGDRLRGELAGVAAADWLLIGPDGTGTQDVRASLRTDDGAIIFIQYNGKLDADLSDALQFPVLDALQFPVTVYVAPRFETGYERYAWLNRIQAVGKGTFHDDLSVDYEWYEVR